MPNTIIQTTRYSKRSQMYLRSSLVGADVCRSQFQPDLYPGYTINFPYVTSVRLQNYSYSTDLIIDPTVYTSNTYSIDQVKAATANFDPLQTITGHEMNPQDMVADEIGYQLARNIDQYILNKGITGSLNTVAGGTLSASNMFETLTQIKAVLFRSRARVGTAFIVVDGPRQAILANTDKANGFQLADSTLKNGFVGPTSAGFMVYVSNDLPYSIPLTIVTEPTAGDTFTVAGKTWTFVAAGTAALPGDISLDGGGTVTDTQLVVRTAINGTGTPGAATYIDLSVDDRRELSNMQISCGAFGANLATITTFGQMYPSAVWASANNFFGTETVSFLAGIIGAIDLTIQSMPKIEVRYPVANVSFNLIGTTQFGGGVFYRDRSSLVKLTANA